MVLEGQSIWGHKRNNNLTVDRVEELLTNIIQDASPENIPRRRITKIDKPWTNPVCQELLTQFHREKRWNTKESFGLWCETAAHEAKKMPNLNPKPCNWTLQANNGTQRKCLDWWNATRHWHARTNCRLSERKLKCISQSTCLLTICPSLRAGAPCWHPHLLARSTPNRWFPTQP